MTEPTTDTLQLLPAAGPVQPMQPVQPADTLRAAAAVRRPARDYCTPSPSRDRILRYFDPDAPAIMAPFGRTAYRDTNAGVLYGSHSELADPQRNAAAERPLNDNALFQGFVLLLAVAYVLLVYHNLIDLVSLLNHVFSDSASDKRSFQEPTGSRYARFLYTTTGIGLLLVGMLIVKHTPPAVAELFFGRFTFAAALVLCLALAAAGAAVWCCQWLLLQLIGFFTRTQPLLGQLRQLRTRYFAAAVLLAAPAMLLFALCPLQTGRGWFALIIIGLAVTLFLYLRETLTLFITKKVSIIHWFLYLCTIEIFPIVLLCQLGGRAL